MEAGRKEECLLKKFLGVLVQLEYNTSRDGYWYTDGILGESKAEKAQRLNY